MAVKLRLMRMGKKKQPTYRVVAADARSPRNGRFIEIVGTYQPRQDPSVIEIDNDKAVHWLQHGAQPTERVAKLLKISGAWEQFTGVAPEIPAVPEPTPNKGYTAPSPAKPKAAPVVEVSAEEAPAEDAAEEAPAEEAAAEEAPAEEAAADEATESDES
ncbi:MAG: 30S ribosomal protein S16 [Acidimicrobiales bacterium]|nr:30S ribosomal protein S16 [Acidimicrobiales bacterium]RZV42034.1 MAG: 30S ribosomal protein S16 [Acidimicrobiales bacterium]